MCEVKPSVYICEVKPSVVSVCVYIYICVRSSRLCIYVRSTNVVWVCVYIYMCVRSAQLCIYVRSSHLLSVCVYIYMCQVSPAVYICQVNQCCVWVCVYICVCQVSPAVYICEVKPSVECVCIYIYMCQVSPSVTELILTFDLLRNFLFDSDEVKVSIDVVACFVVMLIPWCSIVRTVNSLSHGVVTSESCLTVCPTQPQILIDLDVEPHDMAVTGDMAASLNHSCIDYANQSVFTLQRIF